MKVSIIIPVYNGERYLEETINSVINQSFSGWELIVIDDGSIDNSYKKAKAFKDDRVKLHTIENGGVSNARNVGYKLSKGEYIAFLDADDVWISNNLELKVKMLDSNPKLGLVHSDAQIIDEDSNTIKEYRSGKEGYLLEDLLLWNGTSIPAPSSILTRRTVVDSVGGFNLQLSTAADQEFFFRVAGQFEIGRISNVTWYYRIHGDNMHQNIAHMEKDHIRAYRLAEANKLFKSYWFKKRCFSNLYLILAGSWWVNQNKHPRTFLFLLRSALAYPPNLRHILKKLK